MSESIAVVSTVHASKYLQQLCKHFSSRVIVECTDTDGVISLPFGVCKLKANSTELMLTVQADYSSLGRVERVIGDHLARFSFRENLAVVWRSATTID